MDLIKKGTGDFVVQDQPLTDDVDYIEYIPCKYYCAHFMETSQWKHSFVLTPDSRMYCKWITKQMSVQEWEKQDASL